MHIVNVVRWVHIISGISWVGEVITLNVVLVPALIKLNGEARTAYIRQVFPRIFHLATVLSLTAVISGLTMSYLVTGWTDLDSLIGTRWGTGIALGGGLAILLTLFHLFIEERLEPVAMNADMSPEIDIERTMRVLKIVPRVGVVILLMIVSLMVYAARGL